MDALLGSWLSEHGVNATGVLIALWLLGSLRRELLALARAQIAKIQDDEWRNLAVRFVRLVEQTMEGASNEQKANVVKDQLRQAGVPSTEVLARMEEAVHEVKSPLKAVSAEGFVKALDCLDKTLYADDKIGVMAPD